MKDRQGTFLFCKPLQINTLSKYSFPKREGLSDKIRLLLFNLQLLDVVAGIVGLDEDGYGEHVASAVQIADSLLYTISKQRGV